MFQDHGLIVNAVASYVSGDKPRQAPSTSCLCFPCLAALAGVCSGHEPDCQEQGRSWFVRPQPVPPRTVKPQEALESSYELCFNAACALIDEGRLKEAEARLISDRNSRKSCRVFRTN